jgi:hypothetical protein
MKPSPSRARQRLIPWALVLAFVAAGAADAAAQTPVPLTISGREAKGSFYLPGGIAGDLTISFEEVVGLNEEALDVSARLVSPLDDAILARLPGPGVSVVEAFPVMIRIEPSASSALTFSGVVSVSLHTHNLAYVAHSPLALYSGPVDGPLRDITRFVGVGSYRAGGSGGGFSEFMIVSDTRSIDVVIAEKMDRLDAELSHDLVLVGEELAGRPSGGSPTPLARVDTVNDLQQRLGRARTLFGTGATVAAVTEVAEFLDVTKSRSGLVISDVWRAHDDRVNVAGRRRAAAETLRFSLLKATAPGPVFSPEGTPSPEPTPPPSPEPTPPPAP